MQTRPTVVNGLQTSEALLRMVSLEQMLTEGATEHSATQGGLIAKSLIPLCTLL